MLSVLCPWRRWPTARVLPCFGGDTPPRSTWEPIWFLATSFNNSLQPRARTSSTLERQKWIFTASGPNSLLALSQEAVQQTRTVARMTFHPYLARTVEPQQLLRVTSKAMTPKRHAPPLNSTQTSCKTRFTNLATPGTITLAWTWDLLRTAQPQLQQLKLARPSSSEPATRSGQALQVASSTPRQWPLGTNTRFKIAQPRFSPV